MKWECPHCSKELSEQEIIGGICSGCHKTFDTPKQKQPSKLQDNRPSESPEPPQPGKGPLLTLEEKQRIYEEETARIEAQENIKQKLGLSPKPRTGCFGCSAWVLVLAFIFLLAIVLAVGKAKRSAPLPPPPSTTQQMTQQQTKKDALNKEVADEVLRGSTGIIEELTYEVSSTGVIYKIDFCYGMSEIDIRANVKGVCGVLAQIYKGYVYVRGTQGRIIVCSAEYSPLTRRIVVK